MNDEELDAILAKMKPEGPAVGRHIDDGVLLSYREGRLGADRIDEVEKHLASCDSCRALLAALDPVPAEVEAWALGTLQPRRRWPAISAIAALAAGLMLAVIWPVPEQLPAYELRMLGGARASRGQGDDSRVFVPGSLFELVLRPDASVEGEVSLIVLVSTPHGTLRRAPAGGITRAEGGGFRFEMRAKELFGDGYGLRRAHAVIARGTIDEPIEGSEEEIRRRLPVHRWMTVEIEYRGTVEE